MPWILYVMLISFLEVLRSAYWQIPMVESEHRRNYISCTARPSLLATLSLSMAYRLTPWNFSCTRPPWPYLSARAVQLHRPAPLFSAIYAQLRNHCRTLNSRLRTVHPIVPKRDATFRHCKSLTSAPVLCHSDPAAQTEHHTDASIVGIGAVLAQQLASALMEHPVVFARCVLSKAEWQYSATKKGCWAVIWAVRKSWHHVYCRHFFVIADHHAVCWLSTLEDPCRRLRDWILQLQEFDITIKFNCSCLHSDAHVLPCCPLPLSRPAPAPDILLGNTDEALSTPAVLWPRTTNIPPCGANEGHLFLLHRLPFGWRPPFFRPCCHLHEQEFHTSRKHFVQVEFLSWWQSFPVGHPKKYLQVSASSL